MSKIFEEFRFLVSSRKNYTSASGWVNINCPVCGDTRQRGGWLPTGEGGFRYRCQNGGCTFSDSPTGWEPGNGLYGRTKLLFDSLGGDISNIPTSERIRQNGTNTNGNGPRLEKGAIATRFDTQKMPAGSMPIKEAAEQYVEGEAVYNYLKDRSSTFFDTDFPFMWSTTYPDYLLVPYVHFDNRIVGYMGRHITKQRAGRFIQRAQPDYMFNQHLLRMDKMKYVFVVESPLDAVLLRGVATRSNKLTEKQVNLLSLTDRIPILVPDKKGKEFDPYLEIATKKSWPVSVPDWKYKDPGEAIKQLGLLTTIDILTNSMSKSYNSVRLRLRGK